MINLKSNQLAPFFCFCLGVYTYKKTRLKKIQNQINPICIPFFHFDPKPHLENQMGTIFKKIEKDFNESNNLTIHVNELKELLEKEDSVEQVELMANKMKEFIVRQRNGESINILINYLFYHIHPASKSFSELDGDKLLKLEPFFVLMNDYLCKIQDKKLRQRIKILFANLPYSSNREELSHLYLDEREQLEIMVKELQGLEDLLVEELIDRLQMKNVYVSKMELAFIQKLCLPKRKIDFFSTPAQLSPSNRDKLKEAFDAYSPAAIHPVLLKMRQKYSDFKEEYLTKLPESSPKILQRISKGKSFFQNQLALTNDQIRIPYWYHATNESKIEAVIKSQMIQMFVKKGNEQGYTGAWVSSEVESELFGKYVIGLCKNIEKLDNGVVRKSLLLSTKRWRGLLVSIPVNDYASVFSVPTIQDKSKQKEIKRQMARSLATDSVCSYPYKIMSEKQLSFMQKQISSTLGNPNLSLAYWRWKP